jgi:hypothetical protein
LSTIKHITKKAGFEQISVYQLKQWLIKRHKQKKRRGKKVVTAFEEDVWSRLVYATLSTQNGVSVATVQTSIVYSYAIVVRAAEDARNTGYLDDPRIMALKFSDKWVRCFLKLEDMRRRKITHEQKEIPSETAVRKQMAIGQRRSVREQKAESRYDSGHQSPI